MNEIAFDHSSVPSRFERLREDQHERARNARFHATPMITRYLRVAKRWKWLLIGTLAAALTLGIVATLLMTPKYTATAELEIQREGVRVVNLQGVEPETSPVDNEFYQTQYGLLQSETLAERVASELRLYDNSRFFRLFGDAKTADELGGGPSSANTAGRDERVRHAAELLLKHVVIDPERLSRLVSVGVTTPDPTLSTQIANAWTRLFIKISLERRYDASAYARSFLEAKLQQVRQKLQDSERDLVNYAASQHIVTIPANAQGGATVERPIVAEDLASLNSELNSATAARIAAQSRLNGNSSETNETLQDQALSELTSHRAQVASDRAKMLAQYDANYPPAIALADQIAELDRAIAREVARVHNTLVDNYKSAAKRERALAQKVNQLQGNLIDLRRRTIQYNIYQREVDTNRQLYDALLQRYKDVGVAGGVGVSNISVVDPAEVPERPSSPKLLLNLLLSMVLGLGAGVALALILDQADEAISDPRELQSRLGLPLLGTVPRAQEDDPTEELKDPKSALVEAYLAVQTSLAFTTDHGIPRSLAITSTGPGEGKSTSAYALAHTLARTAHRVLVIDADMRSPSQHEIFGLPNDRGLSNYLAGEDDIAGLIQKARNGSPHLLSAGPSPPNAAELLIGQRIEQLLGALAPHYDHVVVDAPPLMGLADTPLIGSHVEGCIFVIESHKTRTSMAQVALERLQNSRTRVIGGLLTKFDEKRADYGYGYNYGYGYGDRGTKIA